MSARSRIRLLAVALLVAGGCTSRPPRFRNAPPVTRLEDQQPIPVPRPNPYNHTVDVFESVARRPVVGSLDVTPLPPAGDVNALDEVPASTWYTPRLGFVALTPGDMVRGPRASGPPELPFKVIKVKSSGNPGFVATDARGERYLLKFDPPGFPGLETATAQVVGRLFWAFGYNVPEDDLIEFERADLRAASERGIEEAALDAVLAQVAAPHAGRYRATASRLIPGIVLGPIAPRGLRHDDPNDRIRHEDRRVLRALRVFGAFVNHSDMRADNSLDVYVGQPGQGFVRHYLLDFGEALGGHGAEHGRLWDGYAHLFSFAEAAHNLLTLGLDVAPWERLQPTPWPSVGAFEARVFDPARWRETTPYAPIRRSQPQDDYWAAKILAALHREHLEALVDSAHYPEAEAGAYVTQVLLERRNKVLKWALHRVGPFEFVRMHGPSVRIRDEGRRILGNAWEASRYVLTLTDDAGHVLETRRVDASTASEFEVALALDTHLTAVGYVLLEVRGLDAAGHATPPAVFHVRVATDGHARLVGVEHRSR